MIVLDLIRNGLVWEETLLKEQIVFLSAAMEVLLAMKCVTMAKL